MDKKIYQSPKCSVEKNTQSSSVKDYSTVMITYPLLGGGIGGLLMALAKVIKFMDWGVIEIGDIFGLFIAGTIIGFPPP